jgi:hypothetical protein
VVIISASSLTAARMRAAGAGLGGRIFEHGHELNAEAAARVPPDCIGRLMVRKEAAALLERLERDAGNVR